MIVLEDPTRERDSDLIHRDGSLAFTGDQSLGGNKLTNVGDPASAQDAATKAYVDASIRGMDWKASCRAATTANITLSGEQTIDAVSVVAGDRVLVKNQSTAAENGLYVCAAGSWARSADADANAEVTSGLAVTVTEGAANGDKTFVLTTNDPITVGSTSLAFSQLGDGGATALNDLSDVVITTPAANHGLRYNGSNWVNTPAAIPVQANLSDGATITIDWATGNIFDVTLGGDRTIAFSNLSVGQCIILHVKQDGTGARLLTWPASVKWGGGAPPTLTTTINRTDTFGFECKTAGGSPAVYGRVLDLDVDI